MTQATQLSEHDSEPGLWDVKLIVNNTKHIPERTVCDIEVVQEMTVSWGHDPYVPQGIMGPHPR